jgi:hypothetical protein
MESPTSGRHVCEYTDQAHVSLECANDPNCERHAWHLAEAKKQFAAQLLSALQSSAGSERYWQIRKSLNIATLTIGLCAIGWSLFGF